MAKKMTNNWKMGNNNQPRRAEATSNNAQHRHCLPIWPRIVAKLSPSVSAADL